jgi:uncharacterized OB-fold protein
MSEQTDVVHVIEFPYTRTTGPVVGPFLTGLRDGKILGNRCGGRVLCPPLEYNPESGATLTPPAVPAVAAAPAADGKPAAKPLPPMPGPSEPTEFVAVGPGGTVRSWTWVSDPSPKHPFDHPFAFALIQLDGADTTLAHAVDAGSAEAMSTGMRVIARFRDERRGAITDVYFVPETAAAVNPAAGLTPGEGTVEVTEHLISVQIRDPLHPHRARFADGLRAATIIGQRSPASGKVYVPGRGYDLLERVEMTEADDVVVPDSGAVSSFTVITPVQYYGQKEVEPYIRASILLDGTDSPIMGVDVRDIPVEQFRVGLRVRAEWRPEAERDLGDIDNRSVRWEGVIARWVPTGEPDADPRPLQEYAF